MAQISLLLSSGSVAASALGLSPATPTPKNESYLCDAMRRQHADRRGAPLFCLAFLAAALCFPAAARAKEPINLPAFIKQLPTRVVDKQGEAGDMVNFVLVGSREQVVKALEDAGWKQVDRTATEAAVRAVLSSIQKKVYLELPMSELYLFGRPQDFGYAHAAPIQVVAERHHFRLWEAPWQTPDGQEIWIGAGTHDVGFEKDRRNGDITHKIDPAVDDERDFIGGTLRQTGAVAGWGYLRLPDPVREATTATGGSFHSDGRVLVVILK